jgi:tetratricopeptide (TPR) repeat protein
MDLGGMMSQTDIPAREREAPVREALAIYRSLGNRHGIASALNQLGIIAYSEGLFAEALEHFEEVYDLHRASGDRIAQSGAMNNLGLATYALGRYEAARDWHLQALAIREQLGFEGRIGQSLSNLALTMLRLGEAGEAEDRARASLQLGLKLNTRMSVVEAIEALAAAAALRGQVERAGRLFGAAAAQRAQFGVLRDWIQRQDLDWACGLLGEAVWTPVWEAAREEGAGWDLERAAAYAMGEGRLF